MAREIKVKLRLADHLSKELPTVGNKIKAFGIKVKRTFDRLLTLRHAIGALIIGRIGKEFIDASSSIEVFGRQLEMVTNNANEAAFALSEIREFARTSPLETEDVVQAYVRLRAVGIDPTMEQMRTLGGVAVLMNRDLSDLLQAFIGLNRRTLRQLGIEIDRTGQKAVIQSGNIKKVVEKDSASIRGALLEVWEERFPNAITKAANTTKSKVAIMKSEVFELSAAVGNKLKPAFDKIVVSIGNAAGALKFLLTATDIEKRKKAITDLSGEIASLELTMKKPGLFSGIPFLKDLKPERLSKMKTELAELQRQLKYIEDHGKKENKKLGTGELGAEGVDQETEQQREAAFQKRFAKIKRETAISIKNIEARKEMRRKALQEETEMEIKAAEERIRINVEAANKQIFLAKQIGFAIASGFGKGTEGLKESLRNVLMVGLDFLFQELVLSKARSLIKIVESGGVIAPVEFAKIAAMSAIYAGARSAVSSFQSGTNFAPGGRAFVHKNEIVDLPRGSRVTNQNQIMNMSSKPVMNINFNGPVDPGTAPTILKKIDDLSDTIRRASRAGMINWNELGVKTI